MVRRGNKQMVSPVHHWIEPEVGPVYSRIDQGAGPLQGSEQGLEAVPT